MNDLISRAAAIKALCDNCNNVQAVCAHYPCKQYIAVENLPSAQPKIVRCKECKHFDVNGWCNYLETAMRPNDYCSRAKRRLDE